MVSVQSCKYCILCVAEIVSCNIRKGYKLEYFKNNLAREVIKQEMDNLMFIGPCIIAIVDE